MKYVLTPYSHKRKSGNITYMPGRSMDFIDTTQLEYLQIFERIVFLLKLRDINKNTKMSLVICLIKLTLNVLWHITIILVEKMMSFEGNRDRC